MSKEKTKKVKIVPRGPWALVKVDPEETRESDFGIIVPDEVEQERKSQGTVEAVGEEVKGIAAGDRVVYGTFAGENLKLRDGAEKLSYKLLNTDDIIAFIR